MYRTHAPELTRFANSHRLLPKWPSLLKALQAWPDVDLALRAGPEWERARAWGWVMESGELTGSGLSHVEELPGGIVAE